MRVAVNPVFVWFEGLDDRVAGGVMMPGSVLVFGFITTADVATKQTKSQMDPFVSNFETCGATLWGLRFDTSFS